MPETPPTPPDPTAALARSISIIRSATPEQPRVLKILFYGQSISTPQWTDQAMAELRAKYPNVVFDYRNLALGGWSAIVLERAAERDLAETFPDLIVFHVYGDHRAYERIMQAFRSKTAADIVIQDDHVVTPPEPVCAKGVQLRWSPPPGCTGHVYFKQRIWDDFMSGLWLPTMAEKYGLALEPRRSAWNDYLVANRLKPEALLADAPHPNAKGWTLMASLFTGWFEAQVARGGKSAPLHPDAVKTHAAPAPGALAKIRFEGNRIEVLAAGPLDGKLQVRIDGKPASDLDGCWQDSRLSPLPNVPDWPALKRVTVAPSYHQADSWTLRLTHFDAVQQKFDFTLASAKGGPDGQGKAEESFASPSGRVAIDPQDWNLAYAREVSGKDVPEGATFQWRRSFVCHDQPAVALPGGAVEQRHIVATGLANGPHVVELALARDAPAVSEIRTYRPPLVN
jgi:hypothetical protein